MAEAKHLQEGPSMLVVKGVKMNPKSLLLKVLLPSVLSVVIIALFIISNNPPGVDNNSSWLESYTPLHSLGTGADGFWVTYPPGHPQGGQPVSHPQWVLDSLKNSCVLLVVHRTGCAWCQPQADRVIELGNKYKDSLTFYDLDLELGGDVESKGYEAIAYDPDDSPHYIALTAIITSIDNNGGAEYCWHGWEGDMDKSDLEGWIKDAIYYYHINSGE
ncbi:MAG: hypothetical protein E3J91_03435 [Hadesarchaea archaeon]|nr:MAG: hypothetical protein E3J91_03435 [Hadesarchaea archaeon]